MNIKYIETDLFFFRLNREEKNKLWKKKQKQSPILWNIIFCPILLKYAKVQSIIKFNDRFYIFQLIKKIETNVLRIEKWLSFELKSKYYKKKSFNLYIYTSPPNYVIWPSEG